MFFSQLSFFPNIFVVFFWIQNLSTIYRLNMSYVRLGTYTYVNVPSICVKFLNFVIKYERMSFGIVSNFLAPEFKLNGIISLKNKHRLHEKKLRILIYTNLLKKALWKIISFLAGCFFWSFSSPWLFLCW